MNEQPNIIKHHFNIIDFLIIVLIAASGISILLRTDIAERIGGDQKEVTVEYKFVIEGIRDTSSVYLVPGTELMIQSDNSNAGSIISSEYHPATAYIALADGTITKTEIPERIDVTGTALVKVRKNEKNEYYLPNSMFLSPGREIYCQTDSLVVMLTVLSVNEIAETQPPATTNG
ncbi:MAG: DUF4330 family protein [Oscillospiraceae bacterium]|nr:DUF4330 family protein [Oscillospiraceae bacterium]